MLSRIEHSSTTLLAVGELNGQPARFEHLDINKVKCTIYRHGNI